MALSDVLFHRYGLVLECDNSLYCENHEGKQEFIRQQHQPRVLVDNVALLAHDVVKNIASSSSSAEQELLPFVVGMDAGIPCTSRTPLSSKSSSNLNCVQEQREATGLGWKAVHDTIQKHWPTVIGLECVKQLGQKSGDDTSDADYILQCLRSLGYWAHSDVLEALDFGAPGPRERLYWGALRDVVGGHNVISMFFNKILMGFKASVMWSAEDMFTMSVEARAEVAEAIGVPLNKEFGPRISKSTKDSQNWKSDHKQMFDANGLPWPYLAEHGANVLDPSGLFAREIEACWLAHSLFPPSAHDGLEFIDINPQTTRLMQPFLKEDMTVKENAKGPEGRSPWREKLPTIVGSTRLVIRVTRMGASTVRLAESFEMMRLIGWDDKQWARPNASGMAMGVEGLDLISNMAGNAFSMWHFGPWQCALLSTYGQFCKMEMDVEGVEEVQMSPQPAHSLISAASDSESLSS